MIQFTIRIVWGKKGTGPLSPVNSGGKKERQIPWFSGEEMRI